MDIKNMAVAIVGNGDIHDPIVIDNHLLVLNYTVDMIVTRDGRILKSRFTDTAPKPAMLDLSANTRLLDL